MSSNASAARIAANKPNAQKSTGPRTPEGKARVSENAYKHGLRSERNPPSKGPSQGDEVRFAGKSRHLANDTALPHERAAFEATLADFLTEFAPATPLETKLVERLAQIDLRLNRAVRMETTHLEMHITMLNRSMAGALPPDGQTQQNWLTTLAFLKNPSATTLIAQYESRLTRDFARTLSQLRTAQNLRRTGPLAGASQERAPLSAMEEKPRNQTQWTDVQESREQTHPAPMPKGPSTSAPSTTQRSHPSDGVVAQNSANQTQPPPHAIANPALTTPPPPSADLASTTSPANAPSQI